MRVLTVRNVNHALAVGVRLLQEDGQREESRAGPVIVAPYPVVTAYEKPLERVLFSAERDANPFFHLVEAAWMLDGRDRAADLTPYVKRFADYAEPGGYVHGAYGARWRQWFGYDQLEVIVRRLRRDLTTRQAVLAMWDATEYRDEEPTTGADDLRGEWRDRPCNTHCYFRVRRELRSAETIRQEEQLVLDLTVMCRSNDLIWGAYGANAVHFSYLLEYVAARLRVSVGKMYQLSNNLHAYVATLEPLLEKVSGRATALCDDRYSLASWQDYAPYPMVTAPSTDELSRLWQYLGELHAAPTKILKSAGIMTMDELQKVRDAHNAGAPLPAGVTAETAALLPLPPASANWTTFSRDVMHAAVAHALHRRGRGAEALVAAGLVTAKDWRAACGEWLQRRAR